MLYTTEEYGRPGHHVVTLFDSATGRSECRCGFLEKEGRCRLDAKTVQQYEEKREDSGEWGFMLRHGALNFAAQFLVLLGASSDAAYRIAIKEINRLCSKLEAAGGEERRPKGPTGEESVRDLMVVKTKGAPRSRNIGGRKRKCTRCRKTGHTKRRCTAAISSAEERGFGLATDLDNDASRAGEEEDKGSMARAEQLITISDCVEFLIELVRCPSASKNSPKEAHRQVSKNERRGDTLWTKWPALQTHVVNQLMARSKRPQRPPCSIAVIVWNQHLAVSRHKLI
ncbi:hypothetical protein PIB30_035607 [Stylosanthes scabra]|uniref:CCHC-type domain-containing protein n=1 Tax=Stylosanthes scabra TaxID=79078 RepID=A0ABU6XAR5_9FABA|nr:hypothetical protein [Stylosanthes scabra]